MVNSCKKHGRDDFYAYLNVCITGVRDLGGNYL